MHRRQWHPENKRQLAVQKGWKSGRRVFFRTKTGVRIVLIHTALKFHYTFSDLWFIIRSKKRILTISSSVVSS